MGKASKLLSVSILTLFILLLIPCRRLSLHIASRYSRLFLRVAGIRVKVIGQTPDASKTYLIVSNHLSYIDVLVIAAFFPTLFVTSTDFPASSKVVRLITKAGGCHFVDRKKRTTLLYDIKYLSILLASGYNVAFFPEATTSPTGELLPFKPALLTCAEHAGVEVLVLAIKYHVENKDEVHFHSGAVLLPHLRNMLKRTPFEVSLTVCGVYPFEGDRKSFAAKLEGLVKDYLANIR